MRYKITMEYDGTNLVGWQKQKDGPSAQEFLVKVRLSEFSFWGIVLFLASWGIELTPKIKWNPWTALFKWIGFHARFSARGRGYIYRILNRRGNSPLRTNRVWHVTYPLNITAMQAGARHLIGHHDFSSFRGAGCQALSPVKTLDKFDITRADDEIIFTVEARSFIYHQVRNMVGTLMEVGCGKRKPEDVKIILEACDRQKAGISAPACGLYLNKVVY